MRIALIAPPWFTVPPVAYGGTEAVVAYLADGLAARGHDVTLFASGGSQTKANLISYYDVPPSEALGSPEVELPHLIAAYERWSEFDVLHDHNVLGLAAAAAVPMPVVVTVHGAVDTIVRRVYDAAGRKVQLVAVSRDQASTLPHGAEVIHNAIQVERMPFSAASEDRVVFLGRMTPDKGVLEAISIARRAGKHLQMLIKVNEPEEHHYYETVVKQALVGADVELTLNATFEQKVAALAGARCALVPIRWREPFGLVMIEAMACGTPVVAFRQGATEEIVVHGQTGFVCDTEREAAEAVDACAALDRATCRSHVERYFSADTAVEAHIRLYERLIRESRA